MFEDSKGEAFCAWLNHYMIITRQCLLMHILATGSSHWSAFDYHEGHLSTASIRDQSTPFKRFNSTLPLPQPHAPLHLSYQKQRRGDGFDKQDACSLIRQVIPNFSMHQPKTNQLYLYFYVGPKTIFKVSCVDWIDLAFMSFTLGEGSFESHEWVDILDFYFQGLWIYCCQVFENNIISL